jgi:hypothetical protein
MLDLLLIGIVDHLVCCVFNRVTNTGRKQEIRESGKTVLGEEFEASV